MSKKILYISDMPADVALNSHEHNYNILLNAYVPKELLMPGAYIVHISHDGWCEIYKHGNCNCKPEITIENIGTHEIVFTLRWRT